MLVKTVLFGSLKERPLCTEPGIKGSKQERKKKKKKGERKKYEETKWRPIVSHCSW